MRICYCVKIMIAFALLVIGFGGCGGRSFLPSQALPRAERRIVWIELDESRKAEDLLNLNLSIDVWEVREKYVIARTTDDAIHALRHKGYPVIVLYTTETNYLTAIASGSEPLRIARVNCTMKQECQALHMPGVVSDFVEQTEQYVIVKVTGQQLVSLLEQGYDAHLLYPTEEEYLESLKTKEVKP